MNLIQNSGFEDITQLPPNDKMMDLRKINEYLKYWYTTINSSPDIYSNLQPDSTYLSSPYFKNFNFNRVPDSLKYFYLQTQIRNGHNHIGLAFWDSTSPKIPLYSWGKENICQ